MIRLLAFVSLFSVTALFPAAAPVQDPGAAPGAEHARLARLAGHWTVVSTFSFGGEPQRFEGKAQAKSILGGRFVQFDEDGVEFGQRSEKQKTWGYNVAAKKYEGTWMYTGSTAVMHLTGTAKNEQTIAGEASFAGEKGEPQDFTWDLQITDADHFSTTLVAPAHGDRPAATFTCVYTRAAQAK